MALKPDIVKDLLCVIAFGTPSSRPPAANLLFYYWPSLNPTLYDRRGIHIKFSGESFSSFAPSYPSMFDMFFSTIVFYVSILVFLL